MFYPLLFLIFLADSVKVNWPKLNTPAFAAEGINEAMGKVRKDPVIGQWVKGHERGVSTNSIRLIHLEEGKKRIE